MSAITLDRQNLDSLNSIHKDDVESYEIVLRDVAQRMVARQPKYDALVDAVRAIEIDLNYGEHKGVEEVLDALAVLDRDGSPCICAIGPDQHLESCSHYLGLAKP